MSSRRDATPRQIIVPHRIATIPRHRQGWRGFYFVSRLRAVFELMQFLHELDSEFPFGWLAIPAELNDERLFESKHGHDIHNACKAIKRYGPSFPWLSKCPLMVVSEKRSVIQRESVPFPCFRRIAPALESEGLNPRGASRDSGRGRNRGTSPLHVAN
jgi:hypothetical protein